MFFFTAAKSFGKFSDPFLVEVHGEILSHVNKEATVNFLQPSHGIVVQDSDVLQPEPIRQGGLVRKDIVSWASPNTLVLTPDLIKATQVQATGTTAGTTNAPYIRPGVRPFGQGKEGGVNLGR